MKKRGQMQLSFGMIFSIILIIFFLIFAFMGIKKLVEIQKNVEIKSFVKNFQEDVNKLWNSNSGSSPLSYSLPEKIEKICFEDEEDNLLGYVDGFPEIRENIEHINLELSLDKETQICFKNFKKVLSL